MPAGVHSSSGSPAARRSVTGRAAGQAVGRVELAGEFGEESGVEKAGDDRLDDRVASGAGPGRAARPEVSQLLEGDVQFEADRLASPLGQHPGRGQAGHCFFERVVLALRHGAGVFGAARLGQRAEHRFGDRGAPRVQFPVDPAGAPEGAGQPQAAVFESVLILIGPGMLTVQFFRDAGQVSPGRAVPGGGEQFSVGVVADIVRQRAGPVHDVLRPRHRDRGVAERGGYQRVTGQPVHPRHFRGGGPVSGGGLPGKPHPRGPVPVPGQPAARHAERRQNPGMHGRLLGLSHRQRPQAIRLSAFWPVGRVSVC